MNDNRRNRNQLANERVNWTEVFVFFILAVLFSMPFRLEIISLRSLLPLPGDLNVLYGIFRGIGPFLGYLIVFFVLKSKVSNPMSLMGSHKVLSIVAALPIFIGLTFGGVFLPEGEDSYSLGIIPAITIVTYAVFEEYGWRGYLQQALVSIKLPIRVIVIAAFWYLWHLNFFNPNVSLQTHVIHFLSLVFGSWGLLKISEVTSSILFAASVHLLFNLFADINCSMTYKLAVMGVSVLTWVIVLVCISKTQKRLAKNKVPAEGQTVE